jgi:hypothetical protein
MHNNQGGVKQKERFDDQNDVSLTYYYQNIIKDL